MDELSDARLEQLLEETKLSLKLLILETLMFESYYERLAQGLVSLTPTENSSSGAGDRSAM